MCGDPRRGLSCRTERRLSVGGLGLRFDPRDARLGFGVLQLEDLGTRERRALRGRFLGFGLTRRRSHRFGFTRLCIALFDCGAVGRTVCVGLLERDDERAVTLAHRSTEGCLLFESRARERLARRRHLRLSGGDATFHLNARLRLRLDGRLERRLRLRDQLAHGLELLLRQAELGSLVSFWGGGKRWISEEEVATLKRAEVGLLGECETAARLGEAGWRVAQLEVLHAEQRCFMGIRSRLEALLEPCELRPGRRVRGGAAR